MRILKYSFEEEVPSKWKLGEFSLKDINLFAGVSAVGKTRVLNTIINLSYCITGKVDKIYSGKWHIVFKIGKDHYDYHIEVKKDKENRNYISKEILLINKRKIIRRNRDKFYFKNKVLPNLGDEEIGIWLLRNEKEVKKIYEGFKRLHIRRATPIARQPPLDEMGGFTKQYMLEKLRTLYDIREKVPNLNVQLFLLYRFHRNIFKQIESDFKEIFPFVLNFRMKDLREIKGFTVPDYLGKAFIPVLVIKEKDIPSQIPFPNLSSGMLKAISKLVDIYTLPDNSVYLIDEIENSMGVNSLPVMLDILMNQSGRIQLIITSHHPYIIRNIDIKYWHIFRRKGGIVEVVKGDDLKKKFSKSQQDIFIQLINSDFIEEGI